MHVRRRIKLDQPIKKLATTPRPFQQQTKHFCTSIQPPTGIGRGCKSYPVRNGRTYIDVPTKVNCRSGPANNSCPQWSSGDPINSAALFIHPVTKYPMNISVRACNLIIESDLEDNPQLRDLRRAAVCTTSLVPEV